MDDLQTALKINCQETGDIIRVNQDLFTPEQSQNLRLYSDSLEFAMNKGLYEKGLREAKRAKEYVLKSLGLID
jgi:hypothetical protein